MRFGGMFTLPGSRSLDAATPAALRERQYMIEYHQPGARRILELPVYRCTEEQHYKEQEEKCEEAGSFVKQSLCMLGKDPVTASEAVQFRRDWYKREGCPWEFNQIVGWIRLYTWTGNIGAYSFFVRQKIARNMSRKQFVLRGKFLEMRVYTDQSNPMILEKLKNTITAESRESPRMQRLYIDTGILDVIGPDIDWLALTGRGAISS